MWRLLSFGKPLQSLLKDSANEVSPQDAPVCVRAHLRRHVDTRLIRGNSRFPPTRSAAGQPSNLLGLGVGDGCPLLHLRSVSLGLRPLGAAERERSTHDQTSGRLASALPRLPPAAWASKSLSPRGSTILRLSTSLLLLQAVATAITPACLRMVGMSGPFFRSRLFATDRQVGTTKA